MLPALCCSNTAVWQLYSLFLVVDVQAVLGVDWQPLGGTNLLKRPFYQDN